MWRLRRHIFPPPAPKSARHCKEIFEARKKSTRQTLTVSQPITEKTKLTVNTLKSFLFRHFFFIFEPKENNMTRKKINYTAIIEKSNDGWYVGQIQEIPEAIAQGKTIEELKENLLDALDLVIDYHREQTTNLYQGRKIIKRKLNLA